MKKILIWDMGMSLKNAGGPSGYLYNIKLYLESHPSQVIDFYSDVTKQNTETTKYKNEIPKSWFNSFRGKLLNYLSEKSWFKIYLTYFFRKKLSDDDVNLANKYDLIHVHTIGHYRLFKGDMRVKSKIILTTHTPEPLIDEIASLSISKLFKILPCLRNYFIKQECSDYKSADFLMFPTKSALEVYEEASPYLKSVFSSISRKIFYVPTSIFPDSITIDDQKYTKGMDTKKNLVVSFVGRHNVIKGYDSLKRLASKYLRSYPDTIFLIGGKEAPLKRLNNENWIELGWINTHQLLSEVDVFVLPNKETYFDIVALEVLRQGVPIVMTRTGGNKWYEEEHAKGVLLYEYDNYETFEEALHKIAIMKESGKLNSFNNEIKEYFLSNLSMEKYIESYERNVLSL